jgi:hypothetical protein
MTEACVLMHGDLAYDTRLAAMCRDHDANEWKRYGRDLRKRLMAGTLQQIIGEFTEKSIPWETHFVDELKGYSKGNLEHALNDLVLVCGARRAASRKCVVGRVARL